MEYMGGCAGRLHNEDKRWEVCISKWWKRYGGLYPDVARLARRRLCVQASSATSERALSKAGLNDTKSRMSLLPDRITHITGLSWELVTQGWGPRDLDGEKVPCGRMLAKLWQCEHERSPPVVRRSPRGHDNRWGGGVSAARCMPMQHPLVGKKHSSGRTNHGALSRRCTGIGKPKGKDVVTPKRPQRLSRKRGRRKVVESSDSGGDDPEYKPATDTARVLQDEFDEVSPKDVMVDGRRLKGHELTNFQLKYVRKAG